MSDVPMSLMFDAPPLALIIWFLYDATGVVRIRDERPIAWSWDQDEDAEAHSWPTLPDRHELAEAFAKRGPVTLSIGVDFIGGMQIATGSCFAASWAPDEYYLALTPSGGPMLWSDEFAAFVDALSRGQRELDRLLSAGVTVRIGAHISLPGEPYAVKAKAVCRSTREIKQLFDAWRADLQNRLS